MRDALGVYMCTIGDIYNFSGEVNMGVRGKQKRDGREGKRLEVMENPLQLLGMIFREGVCPVLLSFLPFRSVPCFCV